MKGNHEWEWSMHCNLKEARVLLIFHACFGVKSYVVPMLRPFLTTDHICGWPALARAGASSGVFQASPCCSASFKLLLPQSASKNVSRIGLECVHTCNNSCQMWSLPGRYRQQTASGPPLYKNPFGEGFNSDWAYINILLIYIYFYYWSYIEGDAKASFSTYPGQWVNGKYFQIGDSYYVYRALMYRNNMGFP